MYLTNPYPITPIMQKWYKEKVMLRVVQELQHCYIVGDGEFTQRVQKDMVTKEIWKVLGIIY